MVWHGVGDIRLDEVSEPEIQAYEHFDRRDAGWIKTELKLPQEAE